MITLSCFAGHTIAVFGLGRSGLSSARALSRGGARVLAWDDNPASRERAHKAGVETADLYQADWSAIDALVLAPGVPLTHPEPHPLAALARRAGVEIIGDVELLARSGVRARTIGITGTNGKSTTTALIGHILARAGRETAVGGNLGVPVLDLEAPGNDGFYVLEMSSYQLDLTHSLAFDIALLLNVSPDHLDRHGGMDGYIAAKTRIFSSATTAIIGVDDENSRAVYEQLRAEGGRPVIPISGSEAVPGGVYVQDGVLHDETSGVKEAVVEMDRLASLPGVHNAQNTAAACAVARAAGLDVEQIRAGLLSFPGLAHRQELLAVIDGVSYVNDSKATNGEAAARALACYGDVYWIAGGRAKADGLTATRPYWGHVRHAYLIGEAANDFADTLTPKVPVTLSGRLSQAVGQARRTALAETGGGAVVLLSPACASFDQYDDFEARGEDFRSLVDALEGERREVGA